MGDNRDMMIAMLSKIITDRKPKTIANYVNKYLLASKEIDDFNDEGQLTAFFKEKKPANKHTYLWSIKTVLDLAPEKNVNGLKWINGEIDENKKTINQFYQEQRKSKKESENWITLKQLQEYNKGQRRALSAMTNKFTGPCRSCKEETFMTDWLITSLYVLDPVNHPPMRVDYNMKILGPGDPAPDDGTGQPINYLKVMNKSTKWFVFADYKTAKAYGVKEIKLSRKMNAMMNIYLKYHPDWKYLFGKDENITKNALQKKVTKAFAGTGKTLGVNMLRHIVISETVDTGLSKSDSFSFADSETLSNALSKSDSFSFTDNETLSTSLGKSDSFSFTDVQTFDNAIGKADSLNITETHSFSLGKSAQDSATISESISILNANRQSALNASALNSNTLN